MSDDAHGIADDQVMAAFERWKNLEDEKARISDDLKELFSEQKAFGHDTKAMRAAFRLKVKLDEASQEDAEHEAKVDLYLAALNAPRASRAYAREIVGDFDAETGEVFDDKASAKLVATVATGMQTEVGRAALVAALDVMIAREEAEEQNQPETANEVRSASTDAPETPGKQCTSVVSKDEAGQNLTGNNSPSDDDAISEVNGKAGLENAVGVEPSSSAPIAPASHGEAEGAVIRFELCPSRPMKRLPFVHCFPDLTKTEYERLSISISENGVEDPIIRDGDTIVDGWSRYNIARSLGMEYPVKQFEGGDVLSFVIDAQRASRGWSQSQERKIAAALCKELPHRAHDINAAFQIEDEFA